MEPCLKWAANPNVLLAVKAFGLKATVQVVDLQVFALPRITLKPLVPSFPCFATIYVSLMEKVQPFSLYCHFFFLFPLVVTTLVELLSFVFAATR